MFFKSYCIRQGGVKWFEISLSLWHQSHKTLDKLKSLSEDNLSEPLMSEPLSTSSEPLKEPSELLYLKHVLTTTYILSDDFQIIFWYKV